MATELKSGQKKKKKAKEKPIEEKVDVQDDFDSKYDLDKYDEEEEDDGMIVNWK